MDPGIIDRLILQSLQGMTGEAEEQELLRWRRAAPGNEQHYAEYRRLWELASVGEAFMEPGPVPDPAAVIRRAEAGSASTVEGRGRNHRIGAPMGVRVAAVAALVMLGVLIAELRPGAAPHLGFGADEFVTGAAETATVALRDGTVIRLAPNSRLRLTGTIHEREVTLAGRAYFAVAERNGERFRIRTSAGDVTVLGTRFDLSSTEDDLRLVVVEGRVAVAARGRAAEIGAGEIGRVLQGTVLPVVQVANVHSLIEWKGNFLAFQATPLAEAAHEIERHYEVRVEITDPVLAARTITTWFSDRSLDEVLRVVCAVAAIDCVVDNGVVTMSPSTGG